MIRINGNKEKKEVNISKDGMYSLLIMKTLVLREEQENVTF